MCSELTYDELRSMAVSPAERGAYSDSPLGEKVGLHMHSTALGTDVHVYLAGSGKIAEVFPHSTRFLVNGDTLFGEAREIWTRLPHRDG